jgi:Cu-processing system permease protein
MEMMLVLLTAEFKNIFRSHWVFIYAGTLALLSYFLVSLGGSPLRLSFSILNVVTYLVPLVTLLYSAIYWYNSEKFVNLILIQNVPRKVIYFSRYLALSTSMILGFLLGLLPVAIFYEITGSAFFLLLVIGIVLTLIFVAVSQFIVVFIKDKTFGLGASFLVWIYLSVLHDGLMFLTMVMFNQYPLKWPVLILTFLNPVNLSRVLLMSEMNLIQLMGFSGAIFQDMFSLELGVSTAVLVLAVWLISPLIFGLFKFKNKDL